MEIPEPLRKLVDYWDDGRETGDAARLASFYTDDGAILLPTGQRVSGRDAIAEHYRNMPAVRQPSM
ncbi:MAG: SgcJ/EcaC family oxidoreductase [Pseudomonadota bacterium]